MRMGVPSYPGGGAGGGLYAGLMSDLPTQASTGLLTWGNQNSATVIESAAGLSISALQDPSAPLRALYGSSKKPTAPYTLMALMAAQMDTQSGGGFGLGWYDGSHKGIYVGMSWALGVGGNLCNLFVQDINDWVFHANLFNPSQNQVPPMPVWLAIRDDGTNVYLGMSYDGVNIFWLYKVAKASSYLGALGYTNFMFNFYPTGIAPTPPKYPLPATATIMSFNVTEG